MKKLTPISDLYNVIEKAKELGAVFIEIRMIKSKFEQFIKSDEFLKLWNQEFTKRAGFSLKNVNKVMELNNLPKVTIYK